MEKINENALNDKGLYWVRLQDDDFRKELISEEWCVAECRLDNHIFRIRHPFNGIRQFHKIAEVDYNQILRQTNESESKHRESKG